MTVRNEELYRMRADECFHVASRIKNDELREQYTHLAQCYLELAEAESALHNARNTAISLSTAVQPQRGLGDLETPATLQTPGLGGDELGTK
jgi:hypothetical protein